MIYDVILIGAGISGAMTAHKLAKYSLRVAVVEAMSDIAMGSTRANSAIVHAGFDAAEGTLKAKLNGIGCAEMPALTAQLDVPYKNCASLVVAFSEEEREALERLQARGIANGIPHLTILEQDELRAKEPNLSKEAVAALYAPTAGIVCPYELAMAAAENAAVNGTAFYFNFKVVTIEKEHGIFFVSDGHQTLQTRYVVNAAGLYSDEIAKIAGEVDFPVTIVPRRGEYLLLDPVCGKMANHTIFTVPTKKGKGILVSPTVDGNLLIGPNAERIAEKDDTATTQAGLDEIFTSAKRMIPALSVRNVITSFAGVRATPNTDDFYIQPSTQIQGLLHLVGIESPGLASSPAVGQYAVDLLVQMGLVLVEREKYIPYRNENGKKYPKFRLLSDEEKIALVKENPAYGKIICRCETVTEGEILDAIRRPLGATNLDMVKRRTRAGMGRCQGGFCSPRVVEILAKEQGVELNKITKNGGNSYILDEVTK